jgi:hypothetical protein
VILNLFVSAIVAAPWASVLRIGPGGPSEVRAHGTTLYNSLYRFDDDLLVNTHAYGAPAGFSPFLHLRRVPGGHMWAHFMQSFDEVWKQATPEG